MLLFDCLPICLFQFLFWLFSKPFAFLAASDKSQVQTQSNHRLLLNFGRPPRSMNQTEPIPQLKHLPIHIPPLDLCFCVG